MHSDRSVANEVVTTACLVKSNAQGIALEPVPTGDGQIAYDDA